MMSKDSPRVLKRFLRYVSIDTQSVRDSATAPSSEKQLQLAKLLVDELQTIGIDNARIGKGGVVYASVAATKGRECAPAIGFIAHMDTSPDASGMDIRPQVIYYVGGDVVLNRDKNIVMTLAQFPELAKYKGQKVVFTDGTTLLGADDKAGVAAIMEMVHYVMENPEMPHARLCIGFTPDEEVARSTENFDLKEFGAQYAYTLDGGEVGTLETETFNAATAVVTIRGIGVHPGLAKGKMVNSLRFAAKFLDALPMEISPECTEGKEGYLHPNFAHGNVSETTIRILVRDHDAELFNKKKDFLRELTEHMNNQYPQAHFAIEIKDSYENMRPYLEQTPKVMGVVRNAFQSCGLQPIEEPIRGGTDGARLSALGLPCPNIFTGGMNFHGVYECLPVDSLEKATQVAIALARQSADVTNLA